MNIQHARLIEAMTAYDKGDAARIQHFLKVHSFAAVIARLEGVDEATQFVLETAAIVHDIGIHVSERKYGSCAGHYQELEGPTEARRLLETLGGYTTEQIERVCWLVGHHHTYNNIKDTDHQILIEADFLVNLFEEDSSEQVIRNVRERIFRTATGIKLLDNMLLAEKWEASVFNRTVAHERAKACHTP